MLESSSSQSTQTHVDVSPQQYFIELKQDGSFPKSNTQIYIIKQNDILRIIFSSRAFFDSSPYLLTSLPKKIKFLSKNEKSKEIIKTQSPNPISLSKNNLRTSRKELERNFTILEGKFNDEGSWECEIRGERTGPLFLQIMMVGRGEDLDGEFIIKELGEPEYVLVEPHIEINGQRLIYSQMIIQTVLSRSLGVYTRWKEFFKSQTQIGYNAFHFAPIQEMGASQSLYSMKDQLKLSPELFPDQNENDFIKLKDIIKHIETQYNAISFIDILLNHTSFDSPWLLNSEESYYNEKNTPHLGSAIVLDKAIIQFSDDLADRKISRYYKGNRIENEEDLNLISQILWEDVISKLGIPNFFKFEVEKIAEAFEQFLKKDFPGVTFSLNEHTDERCISYHDLYHLVKSSKINFGCCSFGVKLDEKKIASFLFENRRSYPPHLFRNILNSLNFEHERMSWDCLGQANINIKGTIRYHIIELKNYEITKKNKLVSNYFTILGNGMAAANNGWIMNANSMEDFAESENFHYLKRTIIIWGDLVKLRYGKKKQDSTFLWKYMKKYVRKMASIFHGFRLDNAHSTPLHVGEYLMRKARKTNPNLLLISELFTGNSEIDAIFAKRIGFNGLVREAQRCHDTPSISHTLNNYGHIYRKTVGSLEKFYETDYKTGEKWYSLVPTNPEGILYDVTHDNPSYYHERTIMDTLSKAALLGFSNCFLGTTKGFDEFYEEKISVVEEGRLYKTHIENAVIENKDKLIHARFLFSPKRNTHNVKIKGSWDNWREFTQMNLKKPDSNLFEALIPLYPGNYEYKYLLDDREWVTDQFKYLTLDNNRNHFMNITKEPSRIHQNISFIRKILNEYQKRIPVNYPEIFLETHGYDIITLFREHKSRLKHYVVIVRNALHHGIHSNVDICINLPGYFHKCKQIFWASDKIFEKPKSQKFLLGMHGEVNEEFELRKFCDIFHNPQTEGSVLHFTYMPVSFVCILKTKVSDTKRTALCTLNNMLKTLPEEKTLFSDLSAIDMNYLMYSCENEEKELNTGDGNFFIKGKGKLPYAGFASIYNDIKHASKYNDLSLPLFDCIRENNWLTDYYLNRLRKRRSLQRLLTLLETYFGLLKLLPKHDIPTYFSKIILYIHRAYRYKVLENIKLPNPKLLFSDFFINLLSASYQFISNVPSATNDNFSFSLAAGLPHFSTGWTRMWGRDTFISFRGEFLISGLIKEAREIILMFASSLRNGLIPNLYDKLQRPRYNCRDACWWFVKAIMDYIDFTKDESILGANVELKFVDDNQFDHFWKREKGERKFMKLVDVVQTIFEMHVRGISFKEWDAGYQIDWEMQDEGFNIELYMDEETGFIMGGSQKNCLTWMDKMGSSGMSGNKGWPATPRDGAPIEMTGILKHCLDFVIKYNAMKIYPYDSVIRKNGKALLFTDWSEKIKKNFERCYYIPIENERDQFHDINQYAVRRRGIYKDIYKSAKERSDYQLRGNACIAIALAPELFTRKNAIIYLGWVEDMLIEKNSLGLKTLEKEDCEYIPFYNNADDSSDRRIAKGYSYHQGPEWVWIYAFFLKAMAVLNAEDPNFKSEIILSFLSNHKAYIQKNEWLALPEMTNNDGNFCEFTCHAQCWSTSCILDACYDLLKLKKN